VAVVGEIGLNGELRAVGQIGARLNEADKLGFKRVVVPRRLRKIEDAPKGLGLLPVRSVGEALHVLIPKS
jgi:DNA repair protein RadA/Sms